jgi:hypothetical protein
VLGSYWSVIEIKYNDQYHQSYKTWYYIVLYHPEHRFMSVFSCVVSPCVGTDLAMGWSPFSKSHQMSGEVGILQLILNVKKVNNFIRKAEHLQWERLTHRPDDGGSKDLWNVGTLLPDYTALQPRRQPSSYSPPWEPQILLGHKLTQGTIRTFSYSDCGKLQEIPRRCIVRATESVVN